MSFINDYILGFYKKPKPQNQEYPLTDGLPSAREARDIRSKVTQEKLDKELAYDATRRKNYLEKITESVNKGYRRVYLPAGNLSLAPHWFEGNDFTGPGLEFANELRAKGYKVYVSKLSFPHHIVSMLVEW